MTDLSPQSQAIMDAWWNHSGNNQTGIAAVLRVLIDEVVPQEDEAPKAQFDCEPTMKRRDGTLTHDHGAYIRRQIWQEELNFRWEQRQQTRALMLAFITELEQI